MERALEAAVGEHLPSAEGHAAVRAAVAQTGYAPVAVPPEDQFFAHPRHADGPLPHLAGVQNDLPLVVDHSLSPTLIGNQPAGRYCAVRWLQAQQGNFSRHSHQPHLLPGQPTALPHRPPRRRPQQGAEGNENQKQHTDRVQEHQVPGEA